MAKPLAINDIDILSLNETWIQQGDEAKIKEMCHINNSFFGKSRNGRGGGVGIVIKDHFPIKQREFGNFTSFEYFAAAVNLAAHKVLILSLYRPPCIKNVTYKDFLEQFESLLA